MKNANKLPLACEVHIAEQPCPRLPNKLRGASLRARFFGDTGQVPWV